MLLLLLPRRRLCVSSVVQYCSNYIFVAAKKKKERRFLSFFTATVVSNKQRRLPWAGQTISRAAGLSYLLIGSLPRNDEQCCCCLPALLFFFRCCWLAGFLSRSHARTHTGALVAQLKRSLFQKDSSIGLHCTALYCCRVVQYSFLSAASSTVTDTSSEGIDGTIDRLIDRDDDGWLTD